MLRSAHWSRFDYGTNFKGHREDKPVKKTLPAMVEQLKELLDREVGRPDVAAPESNMTLL